MLKVKFKRLLNENVNDKYLVTREVDKYKRTTREDFDYWDKPPPPPPRFGRAWSRTAKDEDYFGADHEYFAGSKKVFVFAPDEEYVEFGSTHGGLSHTLKHMWEFDPDTMQKRLEEVVGILEDAILEADDYDEPTGTVEFVYLLDGNQDALKAQARQDREEKKKRKRAISRNEPYTAPDVPRIVGKNSKATLDDIANVNYGQIINTIDVVNDKQEQAQNLTSIEQKIAEVGASMVSDFMNYLQNEILSPEKWRDVHPPRNIKLTGADYFGKEIGKKGQEKKKIARTVGNIRDYDSDIAYYTIDPNAERYVVVFLTRNGFLRTGWSYSKEELHKFEDRVSRNLMTQWSLTRESWNSRSDESKVRQLRRD